LKWLEQLGDLWSTTRFRAQGLSAYAETLMLEETRKGLKAMSLLFLALLLGSALFHSELGLGRTYVYTAMSLAALCTHVYFSSRAIREIRTLHVLGMTLLIISGTAFVLVAHQQGAFGAALFTSVALLFMVIPMVPWGLREASTVTLLIYAVFSSSTWAVKGRFDSETLWTLQAFMLAAGMVSLTLVARGASVRKEEIQSRYDLESAAQLSGPAHGDLEPALPGCGVPRLRRAGRQGAGRVRLRDPRRRSLQAAERRLRTRPW
jgi:hypothetical protein